MEELLEAIRKRKEQLEQGVSLEIRERIEGEIAEYEEQLKRLESTPETRETVLLEVDGMPLESYTISEDAAIIIRCEVESLIEAERVITREEMRARLLLLEEHRQLQLNNGFLETEYGELNERYSDLKKEFEEMETYYKRENGRIKLERDEALKVRDNAARQLEEMAQELESAKIELRRNREAKAFTEAERSAQAEEARKRLLESRIKIYNERWENEFNRVFKLANLAETGEEIRFNYLEHGKYLVITEEEAATIQMMNKPLEMPPFGEQTEDFQSQPLPENEPSGTDQAVEESDVVQQGSGADSESTQDQAESYLPTNESAEATQEAAHSEEATETFEQEMRRRLSDVERVVFGAKEAA